MPRPSSDAEMEGGSFSRCSFRDADLRGANLEGVDLSDLRGVKLDVERAVLLARCHGVRVDLAG